MPGSRLRQWGQQNWPETSQSTDKLLSEDEPTMVRPHELDDGSLIVPLILLVLDSMLVKFLSEILFIMSQFTDEILEAWVSNTACLF